MTKRRFELVGIQTSFYSAQVEADDPTDAIAQEWDARFSEGETLNFELVEVVDTESGVVYDVCHGIPVAQCVSSTTAPATHKSVTPSA